MTTGEILAVTTFFFIFTRKSGKKEAVEVDANKLTPVCKNRYIYTRKTLHKKAKLLGNVYTVIARAPGLLMFSGGISWLPRCDP